MYLISLVIKNKSCKFCFDEIGYSVAISWLPGLPVACDGFGCHWKQRFSKKSKSKLILFYSLILHKDQASWQFNNQKVTRLLFV